VELEVAVAVYEELAVAVYEALAVAVDVYEALA
jgi:hypothetical protein